MLKTKSLIIGVFRPRFYSASAKNMLSERSQEKSIKVAVIGLPNVGKSTFINSIMEKRVCPVSQKVHTTQTFSQAVTYRKNSQIVIFDTPGVISEAEMKKHNLDKKFISSCRHSIQHSDVIAILHDISNRWTRSALHPIILQLLEEYHTKPSFLVLNKVDLVRSKKVLLEVIRALTCGNIALDPNIKKTYRKPWDKKKDAINPETVTEYKGGYPNFQAIFLVSAIKGDGIDQILEHLNSISVEKPWEFRNNEVTDQAPETLIEGFVRARLLDYLPNEIPYKLKTEMEYFSIENNKIYASVLITCPNERHEKLLCGAFDGKLRQITDRVTSDIIESFHAPVTLTISTQVEKKKTED